MDALKELVAFLHQRINEPVIIYDPIFNASAGFVFHNTQQAEFMEAIKGVYCITPNIPEAIQIFGENEMNEKLMELRQSVNIYLKGGHKNNAVSIDVLFTPEDIYTF